MKRIANLVLEELLLVYHMIFNPMAAHAWCGIKLEIIRAASALITKSPAL
jgi:hypothetical protein